MNPGSEKSTEKKPGKLKSAESTRAQNKASMSSQLGPELYRNYLASKSRRMFFFSLMSHAVIVGAALLGITAFVYYLHAGRWDGYYELLTLEHKSVLAAGAIFLSWLWSKSPIAVAGRVLALIESVIGAQVSPEMSLYDYRVALEKQKVWVSVIFINSILVFYLAGGIYYLGGQIYDAYEVTSMNLLKIALGSLVLGTLWSISANSVGRTVIERTNPVLKTIRKSDDGRWLISPSGIFSIILMAFTLYAGFLVTKIDMVKLFSHKGIGGALNIFGSLVNPDWSIIPAVINSMVETIFIALMATLIAVPIAFIMSFFTARNLMKGSALTMAVYNFFRVIFNFTRSVEPLVWAIIFSVWVGVGPFAGMMALMLHSVASLAKLYSEQIESIDRGPIEAIEATGAGRILTVWYAVVPQIILPYLSFTIYRWDINVRMATVIGLVGGGGIGNLLNLYMLQARWYQVGTIVLVIAAVVWVLDYLSAKIREAVY